MNEEDYMLSTVDNPYNPFEEFIAWFKYDMFMGYNTCGLLATMSATSEVFSEELNDRLTVEAMDAIVSMDPMFYCKLTKETARQRKDQLFMQQRSSQ